MYNKCTLYCLNIFFLLNKFLNLRLLNILRAYKMSEIFSIFYFLIWQAYTRTTSPKLGTHGLSVVCVEMCAPRLLKNPLL